MEADRIRAWQRAARTSHRAVFLVGPERVEVREDTLPDEAFDGSHVVTASLGYCRCTSDSKAIALYDKHARVPSNAGQIALGHETVHVVIEAPAESGLHAGDFVLITPGHAATPIDPLTFAADETHGVLAALGYSYRYFGALRPFNAIPARAIPFVAQQGFGRLFNVAPADRAVSLASMAHAEPYACCYGANENIFFRDEEGGFTYDVPPRSVLAYLGGTARMAMINLTIVADRPDEELPRVVYITGSPHKLEDLAGFALIRALQERGTTIVLVDRGVDDIVDRLTADGRPDVVITNYPAQDVYDQAVAIVRPGGNINNYAGATRDDIGFRMAIPPTAPLARPADLAAARIAEMHHPVAANDRERSGGLAPHGTVALLGFDEALDVLDAFLAALPKGHTVWLGDTTPPNELHGATRIDTVDRLDDVFIYSTGAEAAARYTAVEPLLRRSAAVNFVRGDTEIFIASRAIHYTTRHQICGSTVPYTMTNTSEPIAANLARQGDRPIDFDWLVRGVSGLEAAPEMIEAVSESQAFGSFFTLVEIPDLPFVAVEAAAMRDAADTCAAGGRDAAAQALWDAATAVEANDGAWCAAAERAVYKAYDLPYPLDGPGSDA